MSMIALPARTRVTPRWLRRVFRYCSEVLTGIEEARAMAHLYDSLAALSDRELAARGLERQDIPRAVMAAFDRA